MFQYGQILASKLRFLYLALFSLDLIDQMDAQRALVLYSRAADKGKTDGQVHSNIFMREYEYLFKGTVAPD